jgi:hypothetical protein
LRVGWLDAAPVDAAPALKTAEAKQRPHKPGMRGAETNLDRDVNENAAPSWKYH